MTDDQHDPLFKALAGLDPAGGEVPPVAGSTRDQQILEQAMSATSQLTDSPTAEDTSDASHRRTPHSRRPLILGLAAAALVAVLLAGVALIGTPGRGVQPAAAVSDAAEATAAVSSLRVEGRYEEAGRARTVNALVDGTDFHLTLTEDPPTDGAGTHEVIVVGDQMWEPGVSNEPVTVTPDEINAPFPEASRAMLDAAVDGSEVRDRGEESLSGVATRRYAIDLGPVAIDALRRLSPRHTAMFELEHPEDVTALDVWVADGMVRRIDVQLTREDNAGTGQVSQVSLEFLDLGQPVVIRPPG